MSARFQIFADSDFDLVSRGQFENLRTRIYREDQNYLLNVNRTEYVSHIVSEFAVAPLELHFDKVTVSSSEKMIPAEAFPQDFNVFSGKSYPKQMVKYHIPFTGEQQLLRCIPNPQIMSSYPVSLEENEVCLEFLDFYGDPERIKRDADSAVNLIRQQAGHLAKNVAQYNQDLQTQAESVFDSRKAEVMKQQQVIAALGVPVKRSENVPRTFAVPAARKQIVPKPTAPSAKYAPEPALD